MIFNSVFWGNKCEANNDIQFASVRQTSNNDFQVYVYHSAFMNHDISDWTGVQKEMVFSLEKNNLPSGHPQVRAASLAGTFHSPQLCPWPPGPAPRHPIPETSWRRPTSQ